MPNVSIDNAGVIGIAKDLKPDSMPVEAWSSLLNVRCKEKVIQPLGTDSEVYAGGSESPRFFYNLRDPIQPQWLVATNGKIYRVTAGAHTDITKLATTYNNGDGNKWCGFSYHRHQIFNADNGQDLPQVLVPGAANMVDLTNWPAATYCKFMNAYKNFLIAYNITEGASSFPCRIKWSDLADTGQLPSSWDEADPTTLAGENNELEKDGGRILAARHLNDLNFVYKDNSIWYMYPSNDSYIFKFKQMETAQGLLGAHAITTMHKKHYLAISGDIVINDTNRLTSIIDNSNRKWLFDNLHEDYFDRIQLVANYKMNEVWICFPDLTSGGWLNQALIYNTVDKTFTQKELDNYSYLASGIIDTSGISQIIDDDVGVIDFDSTLIDATEYNPARESMMAGKPSSNQYFQMDDFGSGILAGGELMRQGLTVVGRDRFNDWKFDPFSRKQVTRVYPKLSGVGSFAISIGYSATPDGAVAWSPEETFVIGTDKHVDFLASGECVAMKLRALDGQFYTYSGATFVMNVVSENSV